MNLKDILVLIDQQPTCSSRLATAIKLAKQQQAKLTGFYAITPHRASDFEQPYRLAEKAQWQFEQAVEEAGLEGDWVCVRNNFV